MIQNQNALTSLNHHVNVQIIIAISVVQPLNPIGWSIQSIPPQKTCTIMVHIIRFKHQPNFSILLINSSQKKLELALTMYLTLA